MATEQTTTTQNQSKTAKRTKTMPAATDADTMALSMSLCYASAMLRVMIDRFEGHSSQLLQAFGGIAGTDANTLHAILDQVDNAARIVDGE